MKILFRVNAGKSSGLGHLSRSVSLAKEFAKLRFTYHFIINGDDQTIVHEFLQSHKVSLENFYFLNNVSTEEDIIFLIQEFKKGNYDFLILDHYVHDETYQLKLVHHQIRWAQFDYAASNRIYANAVINPNIGASFRMYHGLTNQNAELYVGNSFVIISDKFRRTKLVPESNRILIAMGGTHYSAELIEMINRITEVEEVKFDIVTSTKENFNRVVSRSNVNFFNAPKHPEEIYAKCSVAIVAGGVTTYELAFLRVPMIIVPFAMNQLRNAIQWKEHNFGIFFSSIADFLKNVELVGLLNIKRSAENSFNPNLDFDGLGGKRIVERIANIIQ